MAGILRYVLSYLLWLEGITGMNEWFSTKNGDWRHEFGKARMELRLLLRLFKCVEMFFGQNHLAPEFEEDEDQSLKSLFRRIHDAICEIAQDIKSVRPEIYKDLKNNDYDALFSSLIELKETLKPMTEKALEKLKNSTQSGHCTKEELVEFIHSISEDMEEIKNYSIIGKDPEFEALQDKLEFLENFIAFSASGGVEQRELQDLLAHAEAEAINVAHILNTCWVNSYARLVYEKMQRQPDALDAYIKVLKAYDSSRSSCVQTNSNGKILADFIDSLLDNFWVLLASSSGLKVSAMKMLIEEFRFLGDVIVYHREKFGDLDKDITDLIRALVCEGGIIICSIASDEMEDLIKDIELGLSNFIEKVELFMADMTTKYPETSKYRFPWSNELGFMDVLLEHLKELIEYKPDSVAFAHGQGEIVMEDLVFLRDFVRDMMEKPYEENEQLKALRHRVLEVTNKIERVIIPLASGDPSILFSACSLTSEIKMIKTKIKEIYMEKRCQIEAFNAKTSRYLPSRRSYPSVDEVIIGFEDEAKEITDRLKAGSMQLDIVPIVGMPGLGKTTLAKKVYNDNLIRNHFHVMAWCCISQEYQKRKLLLDILYNIIDELPNGINTMCDEDLEDILRKSLKGRRYLIVLDDVWDFDMWHELKLCFPNDNNGSRILLTSRIHNIAKQAKPNCSPHSLHVLTDDESWELLQIRVLQNKGCPRELHNAGKQIAKNCKGLPLAVVIVAGVLATLQPDSWEDFARKSANLVCDNNECHKLLELSYLHLPNYLKPCLLYFGSFPQVKEVPVSRLIRLWMAEGFVQKNAEKSLENVAEDYLADLIDRSLVQVAKLKSNGGTKACLVHDLVHQFCVTKANEENFLQLLYGCEKLGPFIQPCRLCIYSSRRQFCKARLSFRSLCSLRFFRVADDTGIDWYDVSLTLRNFKLLKVLDLGSMDLGDAFPGEVEMLVHLRYLALFGAFTSIPSTVVRLRNLETFLVKGSRGEISLPHSLLNITKLRHVHVSPRMVFSLPEETVEKFPKLCNLATFSTTFLSSHQDILKIFRNLPNIQKLRCIFFGSWDSHGGYQFPALNFLSQLESLKVLSTGKVQYKLDFSFPLNLKKLTLSKFCLPWSVISRFSELPNLEVLKLLTRAFEGETWDMEEEEFPKLRYLKLENLDIVHWNACSDNFPCLKQLVLHRCRQLQAIPDCVEEIDTLEMIEVKWCHRSTAASAQEILEHEREGLRVSIYPPERD